MVVDAVREKLRERIERGATLDELDTIVRMTRGLRERERAALWRFAWDYEPCAKRGWWKGGWRAATGVRRRRQHAH